MRTYSMNKKDRENSILKFGIKGNTIEVTYASWKIMLIENTLEKQQELLRSMENQVKNCNDFYKRNRKNAKKLPEKWLNILYLTKIF